MASALRGGAQTAHTTPRRRPELRVGDVGYRPCNRSTRLLIGLPHTTPHGCPAAARALARCRFRGHHPTPPTLAARLLAWRDNV